MNITAIRPQVFAFSGSMHSKLDKSKTVCVLGGSMVSDKTMPNLLALQKASEKLAARGYNIVTGGSTGANEYGNRGASSVDPTKSWVIHIEDSPSINKTTGDGRQLYQDYSITKSNATRVDELNKVSQYVIIAKGGAASLEEFAGTLRRMYYPDSNSHNYKLPRKIILVGWDSLRGVVDEMVKDGITGVKNLVEYVHVDYSDPESASNKIVEIVTGRKPLSLVG